MPAANRQGSNSLLTNWPGIVPRDFVVFVAVAAPTAGGLMMETRGFAFVLIERFVTEVARTQRRQQSSAVYSMYSRELALHFYLVVVMS